MTTKETDTEYCPLCGDDFDKHRKTCRFEGTVHGSEVVYCRETGNKVVACPCPRCGFDRSITATHGAPTKKEPPPEVKMEPSPPPVKTPVAVKPPVPVLPTEVAPPLPVKIKYKRQSDVLDLL